MKERPILFSGPMVRAIPGGKKTMTRRVAKPPKKFSDNSYCDPHVCPPSLWWWDGVHTHVGVKQDCPYGQAGDRLWVRETYCFYLCANSDEEEIHYRADGESCPVDGEKVRWRPSIHMPRWASRITLEITDVRVERLQEITEEDAKQEGANIRITNSVNVYSKDFDEGKRSDGSYLNGFIYLWDSLNTKRGYGWNTNPFVWVISFKRIEA